MTFAVDPMRPFCTYTQIYETGKIHKYYGKISSAFDAYHNLGVFMVEIDQTFETIGDAKKAFNGSPELTPVKLKDRLYCHQTGGVYETYAEAARHHGVNLGAMSYHLKGLIPHLKGFTFQKIDAFLFDPRPGLSPDDPDLLEPRVGKKYVRAKAISDAMTDAQWRDYHAKLRLSRPAVPHS